jgi:hypothetical protein
MISALIHLLMIRDARFFIAPTALLLAMLGCDGGSHDQRPDAARAVEPAPPRPAIDFGRLDARGGAQLAISGPMNRPTIELTNPARQDERWRTAARLDLPRDHAATIWLQARGPFVAMFVDESGNPIDRAAGTWDVPTMHVLQATGGAARLLLHRLAHEPGTSTLQVVAAVAEPLTEPRGRATLLDKRDRLADELLRQSHMRRDLKPMLAEAGESIRAAMRDAGSHAAADALHQAYSRWSSVLGRKRPLLDQAHFVAALTPWTVRMARDTGDDVETIIARGAGTCWQQAYAATWMLDTLDARHGARVMASDSARQGHALAVTDQRIIDPSVGVVIDMRPERWSALHDLERVQAVADRLWAAPLPRYALEADVTPVQGDAMLVPPPDDVLRDWHRVMVRLTLHPRDVGIDVPPLD